MLYLCVLRHTEEIREKGRLWKKYIQNEEFCPVFELVKKVWDKDNPHRTHKNACKMQKATQIVEKFLPHFFQNDKNVVHYWCFSVRIIKTQRGSTLDRDHFLPQLVTMQVSSLNCTTLHYTTLKLQFQFTIQFRIHSGGYLRNTVWPWPCSKNRIISTRTI